MTQEKKTILVLVILVGAIALIYFNFSEKGPSPAATTISRLDLLETAVLEYAQTNSGAIPKTLTELGISAESTMDHKKEPFVYTVEERVVTITSLGADGKPGGLMFNADHKVNFVVPEG